MVKAIDYALVWVMGVMLKVVEAVCDAWNRIHEYESMKSRGYTLMQDEKGEDFWVGYGD